MSLVAEAYEDPPPNDWVRPVVVGWALFMGGFGAWGWMAENGYSSEGLVSAAVSLFACVVLLNASVQMRRAGAKKARRATLIWGAALLLFGAWSGYSAHHAFEMTRGGPVEITTLLSLEAAQSAFLLVFFLGSAWIDPLLMWAVEETERASLKTAPAETGQPPANAETQRPPRQPFRPEVVEGGHKPASDGRQPVEASASSAKDQPLVAEPPASPASFAPPDLPIVSHSEKTWPNPEAHAADLLKQRVGQREVARVTGLTRYKVGQIARETEAAA